MNTVEQDFPAYFHAHLQASRMASADEVLTQIVQANMLQFTLTDVSFEDFKAKRNVNNVKNYNVAYFVVNFLRGIGLIALGIIGPKGIYTLRNVEEYNSERKIDNGVKFLRNVGRETIGSKENFYAGVREFQEGWGRLVSKFDNDKGAYYIERSKFHKDAYTYFVKNYNFELHPTEFRLLESQRFNLVDLKNDPNGVIEKFELSETFSKIDKKTFLEKISGLDEGLLSVISIDTFKKYAGILNANFLISDKEFAKLTFDGLFDLAQIGVGYLIERLNRFKKPEGEIVEENTYLDIITRDDVQNMLAKIHPSLSWLFSDEQLLKADFSKLNIEHLRYILVGGRLKIRELVAKVPAALITPDFFRHCSSIFKYLSDDQIRNLTNLNHNLLSAIFPDDLIRSDFKECSRRFSILSAKELQDRLSFLDEKFADLISDELLKQLDFSFINTSSIFNRFFGGEGKEKRIKVLNETQVASIALYLCSRHSLHISDEIIKKIDFRKLDVDETLNILFRHDENIMTARLDLLEPMQLLYAVRHFSIGFVKLISDKQIQNLPYDEMDGFDIRRVFDTRFGEELTRRFNLVPEKMQGMLKHLEAALFYIPEEILKSLDLSGLDSLHLNLLIGTKKRAGSLTEDQLKSCVDKLDVPVLRILPEDKILNLIDAFTDGQLEVIGSFRKETFLKLPENKRNTILARIKT